MRTGVNSASVFLVTGLMLAAAGPFSAGTAASAPAVSSSAGVYSAAVERNRTAARAFMEKLYSADNEGAVEYLSRAYREHQVSAGFTPPGLLAFARGRVEANPQHYLVIHRSIAQGDLVFLHVEERLTPTRSVARGELFRFLPDGRIVEHWSAQQEVPSTDANGNGMFRGSEVNRMAAAGRRYGPAIMENDAVLFRTRNPELVTRTRTSRYLQHNPGVPNGPEGLKGFVTMMRDKNISVEARVVKVVAEGDYVASLNYFKTTPLVDGFGESIVFDVVRVTDSGKVDEHWDIVEDAPGVDRERAF